MKKSMMLLFAIVYFTVAFFYGCSSEKYISKWADSKITVDGRDNDWANKTKFYKDQDILVGVQNDSKNLYVLFETPDRTKKMQIMHMGFIVWLDNNGGSSQDFGIKFPIGGMRRNFYPGEDENEEDQNFTPPTDMEIYNKHDDSWSRVSFTQAKGISVAVSNNDNKLIYEMSIALHPEKGDAYFLNPKSDKIGIGFQTVKFERKTRPQQSMGEEGTEGGEGGEYGGEGGGFGGGRGHRGGGGMRGGEGFSPPEQLNFWLTTTLATNK